MGTDPERSVVNERGRSHDVRNLFVVDGSVFVTSGGVNPTTTIQAVALYIADSIKKNGSRTCSTRYNYERSASNMFHTWVSAKTIDSVYPK